MVDRRAEEFSSGQMAVNTKVTGSMVIFKAEGHTSMQMAINTWVNFMMINSPAEELSLVQTATPYPMKVTSSYFHFNSI